jgi:uncharacterized protein YegP (UPF0339 family)
MNMGFYIVPAKDGKFTVEIRNEKFQTIFEGRNFSSKHEVMRSISDLMQYGERAARYVQKENCGEYIFQLKSPIGRLLGSSYIHTSRPSLLKAIREMRDLCKSGNVIDLCK